MPHLGEVPNADLPGQVRYNFKNHRAAVGEAFAALLQDLTYRSKVRAIYGGAKPIRAALTRLPEMRGLDKATLKARLKTNVLTGWSGFAAPFAMTLLWRCLRILPPLSGAGRFALSNRWGRQEAASSCLATRRHLVSSGREDAVALARVPKAKGFDGYVRTNRIEVTRSAAQGR